MGNLRQKYTDEDWDRICGNIDGDAIIEGSSLRDRVENLRRDRVKLELEIERVEELIKFEELSRSKEVSRGHQGSTDLI